MLTELRVRDFAIIDALNVEFGNGFNVLTGETGAGKSIIVDSIALLMGDRADAGMVRSGAERALIEGVFTLDDGVRREVEARLTEQGLESDEPGQLLMGREVRTNGRTLCRVNGRAVGQNVLRELGELLVDVHGQSEHLSLLRVKEHANLLDRYGNLWDLRAQVASKVSELRSMRKEIKQLIDNARERARRVDMLKFQLEEIRSAKLKPDEETALQDEHLRLANAETLAMYAEEAYGVLYESSRDQQAALDQIATAARALANLSRYDKQFEDYNKSLSDAAAIVQEVARTLQEYREVIEFNPRRLQQVEERLSLIKKLKRKYGDTVDTIIAFAEQAEDELNQIEIAPSVLRHCRIARRLCQRNWRSWLWTFRPGAVSLLNNLARVWRPNCKTCAWAVRASASALHRSRTSGRDGVEIGDSRLQNGDSKGQNKKTNPDKPKGAALNPNLQSPISNLLSPTKYALIPRVSTAWSL